MALFFLGRVNTYKCIQIITKKTLKKHMKIEISSFLWQFLKLKICLVVNIYYNKQLYCHMSIFGSNLYSIQQILEGKIAKS